MTSDFAGLTAPYRCNWGCGPVQPTGWLSIDADPQWNTWRTTLDLPDECCRFIVANHSLQMVGYHDLLATLTELRRVTMRGGWIRILVPDLCGAYGAFLRNDHAWFPVADDVEPRIDGKLCAYLTWYGEARSLFTTMSLADWLERAGWRGPMVCPPGEARGGPEGITDLDSRPTESLIVEARNL